MRTAIAIAAGAAGLLTACSSSSGGTTSTAGAGHPSSGSSVRAVSGRSHSSSPSGAAASSGCTPDYVPRICLTVDITGTTPLTGSGIAAAPAPPEADPSWTCAKLATYVNGDTDLGSSSDSIGGHRVQWDGTVPGFRGPGTYSLSGTEFYLNIDNHSYSAVRSEILHTNPTASVTVDGHFGVQLTFKNLATLGHPEQQIAGTLRWTCVDPR